MLWTFSKINKKSKGIQSNNTKKKFSDQIIFLRKKEEKNHVRLYKKKIANIIIKKRLWSHKKLKKSMLSNKKIKITS